MSLLFSKLLIDTAHWTRIERVKTNRGETIKETDMGDIKCIIDDDTFSYRSDDNDYINIPSQTFICGLDCEVKAGDILNGMYVHNVSLCKTLSKPDHYEIVAYKKKN